MSSVLLIRPNEFGSTRREELLEEFFSTRSDGAKIEECSTSEVGDLRVALEGGYALEIFPDVSDGDDEPEYWRLVKRDAWHIVVGSQGIALLD